jgi:hypothetical protein
LSIFVGGSEITEIKIGATTINEVYVGSTLVWSANHRVTQGYAGTSTFNVSGFQTTRVGGSNLGSVSPTRLNGVDIEGIRVTYQDFGYGTPFKKLEVWVDGQQSENLFSSVSFNSMGTKYTGSGTGYSYFQYPSDHQSFQDVTVWQWLLTTSERADFDGSGVVEVEFA